MKNVKRILLALMLAFSVVLSGCGSQAASVSGSGYTDSGEGKEASFEITMLDVGQGLSLLIQADGEYMIYDGGGRSYSSYVVSYLKKHGIDSLKYMAVSHYDEDHINGLVGVLNTTEVETALTPDYEADSKIYQSFRSMLKENGADEEHPVAGDSYSLGDADIEVLSPAKYTGDDENDESMVIKVTYGDFSCLITGDAEKNAEEQMLYNDMDVSADLYVAGHHGSASSSGREFVKAVSPDYVFISVGADNSYGHPAQETLDTFNALGIKIFRTDLQGEVTCSSDGANYWFSTDNVSEEEVEEESAAVEPETSYVINKNSGVFHRPDCGSVDKMKESNKIYSEDSRDELVKEGYSPCGNCNP